VAVDGEWVVRWAAFGLRPLATKNHLTRASFATIQELYGRILDFALDPLGCYALVRSFEIATQNEQRQALAEILPSTMEVCMDQIGHRVSPPPVPAPSALVTDYWMTA
jgi:hypothetical protein